MFASATRKLQLQGHLATIYLSLHAAPSDDRSLVTPTAKHTDRRSDDILSFTIPQIVFDSPETRPGSRFTSIPNLTLSDAIIREICAAL